MSFRRRDARAIYEQHAGPNMTPMVDVVMVILIFFMASTTLLGPEVLLRAQLAAAETETASGSARLAPPTFMVKLVASGGTVAVEGMGLRRAPLDRLASAAATAREQLGSFASGVESPVVIEAEDEVPYEAVIAAQDILRRAGFEQVGIR
ncbi:MAG: biopolymer transporter ExbD [Planctomycetota bacterium]